MNRDQEKAMFAKKKKIPIQKIDGEKYLVGEKTGWSNTPNLERIGSIDERQAKGLRAFKTNVLRNDFKKEISALEKPSKNWLSKLHNNPVYLNQHPNSDQFEKMWLSTILSPEREKILKDALGFTDDDSIRWYASMYPHQFGKNERKKIMNAMQNISPAEHEWYLLDDVEEEVQIYGADHIKYNNFFPRLPPQHKKFILDAGNNGHEAVKRIRILKKMLTGNTKKWNSDIDERYRRIEVSDSELTNVS